MEEMYFFDAEIVEDDPDAPVGILVKAGDPVKKEEPAPEPVPVVAEEPTEDTFAEPAEEAEDVPAEEEPVEEEEELTAEEEPEDEPVSEVDAPEDIEESDTEEEPAVEEQPAEDESAAEEEIPAEEETVEEEEEEPAAEETTQTEDEEIAQIIKELQDKVAAEEAALAAASVVEEEPVQAEDIPAEEEIPAPVAEETPAEETPAPVSVADETEAKEDSEEEEEEEELPAFPNMRYNKSFTARLTLAPDAIKQYYNELKNALLSYKKVSSRISWACDSINSGRKKLAVLNVKGKSLYLYLALDAADYADTKYTVVNVETKKYEATPCLYKIKSDRKAKWALELIKELAEKAELAEGKESAENFIPEKATVEELVDKGLIKLVAVNEKEADEAPAEEPVKEEAPAPAPVKEEPVKEEEKPAEVHNIKTSKMSLQNGEGLQTELNDTKFEVEKKKQPKVIKPKKQASPDDIWAVAVISKKQEPVKKEEKPEPKKEEVKKVPAKKETVKKDAKAEPVKKEEPAKKANEDKKVVGKFIIEQNEDIFIFSLYANNGQLLYESREYASKASCKSGIETFKKNIATCDYRIAQDKNKNWKYIFRKGNSIYIGESYKSEQSATNSAESTKRFAAISDIVE